MQVDHRNGSARIRQPHLNKIIAAAAALILVAGSECMVLAVNKEWDVNGVGDWSVAGNWLPSGVPGSGDFAFVRNHSTAIAQITTLVPAVSGVQVTDFSQVDISTGGSLSVLNNFNLGNGFNTLGTVNQTGGSLSVGVDLLIGRATGPGNYGMTGGTLSVGSQLFVGFADPLTTGTMTQSGGTVTAPFTFIGANSSAVGIYNLSGTGALIANSELNVGRFSTGTLNQTGGSVTANAGFHIGNSSTANGTYNISGGTASASDMLVGTSGTGAVTQTGGSITVSGAILLAAASATSSGTYNLNGGSISSNRTFAGLSGPGQMTLGGGTLTTNELRVDLGPNPVLTFNSGTINTKLTNVSNGAPLVVGNGSGTAVLNLDGGTHIFANGLTISNRGTLKGTGTTTATVTVNSGGTIAPGASPGILSTGSVSFANNSNLVAELASGGGVAGTDYDQINVTGSVALDNTANLTVLLGYGPSNGDTFTLINNDSSDLVTGRFTGLPINGSPGYAYFGSQAYQFTINYDGGTGNNDVVLSSSGSTNTPQGQLLPEPASVALLLVLSGLGLTRRRRPSA